MPEANYPLRNWVSGPPPVSAFDMQQINTGIDDLDYRLAKIEDVKGEGDWTLTTTQAIPANQDTRILFGLQNIPPVGLTLSTQSYAEPGNIHNASKLIITTPGKWLLKFSARWTNSPLVSTERYIMMGPAAGGAVYYDKQSASGYAFNLSVTCMEWFAAGTEICCFAYNSSASS
ncbi:hypothetical protein, partial [Amycolatopsis sp. BJA-103]